MNMVKTFRDVVQNAFAKKASLFKEAEGTPTIKTALNRANFSIFDDELLKKTSNFPQDKQLESIDFYPDESQSYIEWTIDAQVKGDTVVLVPTVKEIKAVGDILAYTVGTDDEEEIKTENVEVPIDLGKVSTELTAETGTIKLYDIEVSADKVAVRFWDREF